MTREQQIDQEARDLWQAMKGGSPPCGLHGSALIDALDQRVIVEHATDRGARAHRDDPLGLGHLIVDAAQRRRHLA